MFTNNIKGVKKMRKILCSVLALLMLFSAFSCFSVTGFAADTALTEKESNDTAATANEIKVAETNVGALQSSKDVDWYKFTSDKDYFTVDFGYQNISDQDGVYYTWKLTIYNENLKTIKYYVNFSSFSSLKFPITGTIYVKVEAEYVGSSDIVNIPYILTAKTYTDAHWENENNESSSVATVLTSNQQYVGALQEVGDVDWYKFTSDKDYFTVDFGYQNISDKDGVSYTWKVTIYDETLQTIKYYVAFSSFSSPEFPITGTIYVKVEAEYVGSSDIVNIPYALTAKTYTNAQWESEYNNDTTKANVIEYAKNYKGSFHSSSDVDVFKFKSTTDAFKIKFAIDLNETPADKVGNGWKITVFPVDSASSIVGNYVVSSIGSFETRTLPYEKGKEYFIKVEPAYTGSAPLHALYNIAVVDATDGKKWENENGGKDFKWATTVNKNEVVYGNMYSRDDNDYYKFVVPTDGLLNFTFNREESDKFNDGWNFTLKDSAGNVVYTNSVKNTLSLKSESVNVGKGNYYLVVSSGYTAPESYIDYNIQFNYSMHTPKITKVSNSASGITVKWNKTPGVASYVLYRCEYNASTKKWSGWKAIKKPGASATSFVDKTAKSGVKYKYTLKGVYGEYKSPFVSTGSIICLAQPTVTVKAVSSGINVTWTKSTGATGYTIYRSEYNAKTKKWSGWKSVKTAKASSKSYTDKTAKKGVKYRYAVKAVNGKVASSYKASSSVKR